MRGDDNCDVDAGVEREGLSMANDVAVDPFEDGVRMESTGGGMRLDGVGPGGSLAEGGKGIEDVKDSELGICKLGPRSVTGDVGAVESVEFNELVADSEEASESLLIESRSKLKTGGMTIEGFIVSMLGIGYPRSIGAGMPKLKEGSAWVSSSSFWKSRRSGWSRDPFIRFLCGPASRKKMFFSEMYPFDDKLKSQTNLRCRIGYHLIGIPPVPYRIARPVSAAHSAPVSHGQHGRNRSTYIEVPIPRRSQVDFVAP